MDNTQTEESLTVGKMSRTAGHSMRKIDMDDPSQLVLTQNLHDDDVRVVPTSASGEMRPLLTNEVAQVVSKGGQIPDQFRQG